MQLSPSTFPIDPSLLTQLMPGGVPNAASSVPATPAGQDAVSFAELLPGAGPVAASLGADPVTPLAAIDAPLSSDRPEMPVLGSEPIPFPRFVAAAPEISTEATEAPVATIGNAEEPSTPVVGEAKDKAPKGPISPKRQAIAARPEQPQKQPAPELIFSAAIPAPVVDDLPPTPVAEETEGADSEQPEPALARPAEISIRIKTPGAPALVVGFTPANELAVMQPPKAETSPAPVSRETPRVPQGIIRGKPQSNPPSPSQAPEHNPIWSRRSMAMAPSAPQTESADPTPLEPAAVTPGAESRFPLPPQITQPRQSVPVLPELPTEPVATIPTQTLPQASEQGKPQSSLPPISEAFDRTSVWAMRPASVRPTEPVVTNEPPIVNRPFSLSAVPAEIAPQFPAPAVPSPLPLSAETIEATVAPALEPNVSPLPEAGLPEMDPRESRENFAGPANEFRVNFEPVDRAPQKIFVSAETERLTPRQKSVGIGVAKMVATMPSRFSFTPTPHPAFEYAPAAAVSALEDRATFVSEAPAPAAAPQEVASAHQAVEAVLRAVDHVATREQHSVNLHFSVGETDLKVRVELRADEVRTTFSTDSAELRSALSHEWQAVGHSDGSGSVRIAPATFTSDHSATNLSGDASSRDRQQHQQAHHGQNEFAQGRAAFGRPASQAISDARPGVVPASHFVHAGSRHLSTLA